MDDALSAASLLLAALALVYGAWTGEIEREASRSYASNPATKVDEQSLTRAVLWTKAAPLAAAGWAILAVFLPRAGLVAWDTGCSMLAGTWRYSDVHTIFVLSTVLTLGLALHLGGRVRALRKQLRE